jgi:hypothetical protein
VPWVFVGSNGNVDAKAVTSVRKARGLRDILGRAYVSDRTLAKLCQFGHLRFSLTFLTAFMCTSILYFQGFRFGAIMQVIVARVGKDACVVGMTNTMGWLFLI